MGVRAMRSVGILLAALCAGGLFPRAGVAAEQPIRLVIEPGPIVLDGPRAGAQLLATGFFADDSVQDLTAKVEWDSVNREVVSVDTTGQVSPQGDGQTEIIARLGSLEARQIVTVRDFSRALPVQFVHEVLPALTRSGCNQGACHGTPTGKNGFRLSLRGYDPKLDFLTLTHEVGTRRTNPMEPERSLILLKGTGAIDHQGGQRFNSSSYCYRVLRDWVAQGLPQQPADSPSLTGLEVYPASRVLDFPATSQQLVVRARFADGSVRDLTRLARFSSSDETIAQVDAQGTVRRKQRGELTILVNVESQVATSRLIFLEPVPGFAWKSPPETNFVDHHVFAKLKLMRIEPSEVADDATFLRRVYLDTMGLIPTPDEVRRFLADPSAGKRSKLIDVVLERPEFFDFWALKWADRLGCNQRFVGHKGAYSYHRWIRDQVAANVPFDQFVRAIVTASGSNYTNPPASFYRRVRNPQEAVETVSQLFLGVRLQCAKCHNHVSERWTQDDYYGMAAFFSQVRYKNGPQIFAQYNKEETVYVLPGAEVVQPRTGQRMQPKPLGAPAMNVAANDDRREALADWLVSPENPFFARAAVNRIWYHLFGRGIVDPVDDLRDSNPPSSAELLQALADDLVAHRFDTRHTMRTILNSRTYQLASRTNPTNVADGRYFSHAMVRLLSAEQLLDAVSRASGVPERLFHLPAGTRAAQIPDGEFNHPLLRTFGQPSRSEACECERGTESTLEQALQVVGGPTIHAKITAQDNRIGRLLAAKADNETIITELFLATLGRSPSADELAAARERFAGRPDERRRLAEDLLWSLFNHPEFLFQH